MEAIYISLGLSLIGYYLANNQKTELNNIDVNPLDATDIYNNNFTKIVQKKTEDNAKEEHIKYNSIMNKAKNISNLKTPIKSELTGEIIENFSHNNQIPFFRGNHTGIVDEDRFINKLSSLTGMDPLYEKKKEVGVFFKPEENIQEINGNKVTLEKELNYYEPGRMKNGELPFQSEKVGPGLGQDDLIGGNNGFNSGLDRDTFMNRYKTVDELRVATNPKITYDGRNVHGIKHKLHNNNMGDVCKNRPERTANLNSGHMLKTTGAYTGQRQYPSPIDKATNRQETGKYEYEGIAGDKTQQHYVDGEYQFNNINQLDDFGYRNLTGEDYGKGVEFDYGKSNILLYTNERTETTCKTQTTNLTSYIKALTAPLLDLAKTTNKEYFVQNPRTYGIVSADMANKMTVYDPNDIMRTTIKETLIHDNVKNNLKGNEKGMVYQQDDAKTTLRETLPNQYNANLQAPDMSYVYDPEEVARTTMKETTLYQDMSGNIGTREKEGLGYLTNDASMKYTSKQDIVDNDYIGIADREGGTGYMVTEIDPRYTSKHDISNNEYFGITSDKDKKAMSQTQYDNVIIDERKEKAINLKGRRPTNSGPKVIKGVEVLNARLKNNCKTTSTRENINASKIWQSFGGVETLGAQDCNKPLDNAFKNILDISVNDVTQKNPYVLSVTDNL
jgi:hypothetical protein